MKENATICELYCKMALGAIVSELRDELGKQSRVLVANAAKKRLGEKMFTYLKVEEKSSGGKNDIMSMCNSIHAMGGPHITCDQEGDEITIHIHECHLIEAARMEPYICEITQGWIESMVNMVYDECYIIERESTILEGNPTCTFKCRKNYQAAQNSISAIKRIEDLQTKISEKIVMILEFENIQEFNDFSLYLNKNLNAEIKNVNMLDGKYIVEVTVYREGLTRIR